MSDSRVKLSVPDLALAAEEVAVAERQNLSTITPEDLITLVIDRINGLFGNNFPVQGLSGIVRLAVCEVLGRHFDLSLEVLEIDQQKAMSEVIAEVARVIRQSAFNQFLDAIADMALTMKAARLLEPNIFAVEVELKVPSGLRRPRLDISQATTPELLRSAATYSKLGRHDLEIDVREELATRTMDSKASIENLISLAFCLEKIGQAQDALELTNQTLTSHSTEIENHPMLKFKLLRRQYRLGRMLKMGVDPNFYREYFEGIMPTLPRADKILALKVLAAIYTDEGNYDLLATAKVEIKALEDGLGRLHKNGPHQAPPVEGFRASDSTDALANLDKLSLPDLWRWMRVLRGDYEKLFQICDEILGRPGVSPDQKISILRCCFACARDLDNTELEITFLRRILEIQETHYPTDASSTRAKITMLEGAHSRRQISSPSEAVAMIDNLRLSLLFRWAKVAYETNDVDNWIILTKAIVKNPQTYPILREKNLAKLAFHYGRVGDIKEAIRWAEELLLHQDYHQMRNAESTRRWLERLRERIEGAQFAAVGPHQPAAEPQVGPAPAAPPASTRPLSDVHTGLDPLKVVHPIHVLLKWLRKLKGDLKNWPVDSGQYTIPEDQIPGLASSLTPLLANSNQIFRTLHDPELPAMLTAIEANIAAGKLTLKFLNKLIDKLEG